MNQEIFDKLTEVKKKIHEQMLIFWQRKKEQEEWERTNLSPLQAEERELIKGCDHINPDGSSAITSAPMWGSRCNLCGQYDDYLWEDVAENPNHPCNRDKK